MTLAQLYIQQVKAGEVTVGKHVAQAITRHLDDLARVGKEDFPYFFDEKEAARKLAFIGLTRHTKGKYAGELFNLQPWQAFIYWVVYGWKRNLDGKRRFQKAYVEIARKNGKTEMMAPACLDALLLDGEAGAEVYAAATKKDQANILFHAAQVMAKRLKRDSRAIDNALTVQKYSVFVEQTNSKFQALGADADTMDGLNVHCAVVDEYHAHKDDSVLKILETAMGSREQALMWVITTAGFNRHGPCYLFRSVVIDILEGLKTDDSVFGIIYTLDDGDDWKDEKTWVKSNPSIGITPTWDYMRAAFQRAKNEGASAEVQFKTKNLNLWVDAAKTWIPFEVWDANAGDFDPEDLAGRPCYGGLDLSSVRDLSALVLFFPAQEEGERHKILSWHFCPEDTTRVKANAVGAYLQWKRDGDLIATPGNVIDYEFIKAKILQCCEQYDVKSIAFDRYNATQIVIELQNEGIKMEPYGQGFVSMSAPTKELEKMLFEEGIAHNGNSLLKWELGNIEIKQDPASNIKPTKKQDDAKIDGIVALIMAVGQWIIEGKDVQQKSIYEINELWQ